MKFILAVLGVVFMGSFAMANDCCCVKPKPKHKAVCQAKVVTKTVVVEKQVPVYKEIVRERVVIRTVQRKNRLSLMGGMGPNSLEMVPGEARIIREPVAGAQYQRLFSERWNVGIQVQTNSTWLGSVGYDF